VSSVAWVESRAAEQQHVYERRPGDACAALPPGYQRREPEKTVLYQAVQAHLATFLAELRAADERGLPQYVELEFTRYLACGILGEGFTRVRCDGCGNDFLVAFSCKSRGICPSCTARRAHEVAAHLVHHVLPRVPVRQWVFSFPRRIRWHLGNDPDLMASALNIFLRALFTFHRRRARRLGVVRPSCGSITFVQRFGSALQSNVHFHVVVPDGVFVETEEGAPAEFHELPPPSDEDVANLLSQVGRRVTRLLERRGRLEENAAPTDVLEVLKGASVQARLPLPQCEPSWAPPPKRRCATQDGFSLHANVRIHANDRQALEQLCHYGARGAISLERLEERPDGRLSYRMRRPAPDGSTHLVLTPLALLKKLAALIPPPRVHHVRFHGVFGPAARLRPGVTALAKPELPYVQEPELAVGPITNASSIHRASRLDWAALLKRVFEIEILRCARCGAGMRVVAFITDRKASARILEHLGLPSHFRPLGKARAPPQLPLPD